VDAHDLLQRHGEHAVGIGRAKVVFDRERHPREVGEGLDRSGIEPCVVELAPVQVHVAVHAGEKRSEALEL